MDLDSDNDDFDNFLQNQTQSEPIQTNINQDNNQDLSDDNEILVQYNEMENRKKMMNALLQVKTDDDYQFDAQNNEQRNQNIANHPNLFEDKILQKILENEKHDKEFIKTTKRIRKNPEQFRNFLKFYIFINIIKYIEMIKNVCQDYIFALILTRFELNQLTLLEGLKDNKNISLYSKLKTIIYQFKKCFYFRIQAEGKTLEENLQDSENNQFGYIQIMMIFYKLLQYLGYSVQFVTIIDLRLLDIDKNFKIVDKKKQTKAKIQTFKFIGESKPKKVKKNQSYKDVLQEKLQQKSKEYFQKSLQNNDDMEQDINDVDIKQEQVESNPIFMDDLLEDFKFQTKKSKSNLQKSTPKPIDQILQNLNSLSQKNQKKQVFYDPFQFQFDKQNKKSEMDRNDYQEFSQIKYWLEVYDTDTKNFIQVDPVHGLITLTESINSKIKNMPVLFILGIFQVNQNYNYIKNRVLKNIFIEDLTIKYTQQFLKILINRRKLNVFDWWNETSKLFKFYQTINQLNDKEIDLTMIHYQKQMIKQKNIDTIPQSVQEFYVSPLYILQSQLKKYQCFKLDSKPIEGYSFKEESIFLRSDVLEVHSEIHWKILGRTLLPYQLPIKQVKQQTNQQKNIDLYAEYQTQQTVNQLNEDGTFPKSKYGNYELLWGDPPPGTAHLKMENINKVCKKLKVDFIEVITGFEAGSRILPIKEGVLVYSRDEEHVRKQYPKYLEQLQQEKQDKLKKNLMGTWNQLFKAVLLKKQVDEKYKEFDN